MINIFGLIITYSPKGTKNLNHRKTSYVHTTSGETRKAIDSSLVYKIRNANQPRFNSVSCCYNERVKQLNILTDY